MPRPVVEEGAPSAAALAALLGDWPFTPHPWPWRTQAAGEAALLRARVGASIEHPDARVWCARVGSALTGLAVLQPLAWDSGVLELSCARLELWVIGDYATARDAATALVDAARAHARDDGIRHISLRLPAGHEAAAHAVEDAGGLLVDALLTFARPLDGRDAPPVREGVPIRTARPEDTAALQTIAAESFRHGRFHADPSIPAARAAEVYRAWTAGCCAGRAADIVLVAETGGEPAGFIACRSIADTAAHLGQAAGTIVLVASRAGRRRQGVGASLVEAASVWFRTRGIAVVEVGTQLHNTAAARLYQRLGFSLIAGSLSFRLWIEP